MSFESHILTKPRYAGKLEQVSAVCHHLGFFNNVGLTAYYKLPQQSQLLFIGLRHIIQQAVASVIRQHPILFALPVNEYSPSSYFALLPSIDLNKTIQFIQRQQDGSQDASQLPSDPSQRHDEELDHWLEQEHNKDFKEDYGTLPFWRLVVLYDPKHTQRFSVTFIYHHAIGDGVTGLIFHDALRAALGNCLAGGEPASSTYSNDGSIVSSDSIPEISLSLEELHPLHAPPPTTDSESDSPPTQWTGGEIRAPLRARWSSIYLRPEISQSFFADCRSKKVSVTSVLSALVTSVVFAKLPQDVEALTCIIPINLRPWLDDSYGNPNATMGTYFDAVKVQISRKDQQVGYNAGDPWEGASVVSEALKKTLTNKSPSGEPYTAVGMFKSIPDLAPLFESLVGNPRDAAVEFTNVGRFPDPKILDSGAPKETNLGQVLVEKVLVSRSPVVTGAAITVTTATGGDGSITVGFSWQNGVIDDGLAESTRREVGEFFHRYST